MSADPRPIGDTELLTSSVSDAPAERTPLDLDLVQLRNLLERADIKGARAFVEHLSTKWPDSDRVRHYVRVLAPPVVTMRAGEAGHSRQHERAWLQQHAREYAGHWLALRGDELIAADPDLGVVLAAVRSSRRDDDALLHFEPGTTG
jgi:hypothetical protein